ncbi:hypothetical protein HBQ70_01855 [Staphylococcus aureus]|nr:hypothetical protein [Staphylococcus aureus]
MGIVPEVVMWRDIGARIWALHLKLLCRGNIMGIVPEVVMWRDIGARIQR